MTLLEKIASRIDNDNGYDNLKLAKDIEEIAKRYAKEVLQCAAKNARTVKNGNSGSWYDASVDKQSILNTKLL
ncbi:hypothetical protein [Joostella sp.]|uniref:hypothetical protein n=1 Tax=Joostella sp. TaxID=2231138 RepID=UPI003A8E3FF9